MQMSAKIETQTDLDGTLLAIASAEGELIVGIPKKAAYHRRGRRIPLWYVALINEYGTADGRIPSRPAVTWAFDRFGKTWQRSLLSRAQQVLRGRITMETAISRTGERMVADIEKAYHRMRSPRNADSTIANKRAKGSPTPRQPLHDTGRLAKAWRWVWVPANKRLRAPGIDKRFSKLRMDMRWGTKI